MPEFEHQVPEDVRKASKWDDDYACYVAPDGRYWGYTDDPKNEGVSWRGSDGNPISIAVWM
jgi:hypothetical protein